MSGPTSTRSPGLPRHCTRPAPIQRRQIALRDSRHRRFRGGHCNRDRSACAREYRIFSCLARSRAVGPINCINPIALLPERASGSNADSWRISPATSMGSTPAFADQRRMEASNGSAYATRHTSRGTFEERLRFELRENLADGDDGRTVVARRRRGLGSLEQQARLARGGISGAQFEFSRCVEADGAQRIRARVAAHCGERNGPIQFRNRRDGWNGSEHVREYPRARDLARRTRTEA